MLPVPELWSLGIIPAGNHASQRDPSVVQHAQTGPLTDRAQRQRKHESSKAGGRRPGGCFGASVQTPPSPPSSSPLSNSVFSARIPMTDSEGVGRQVNFSAACGALRDRQARPPRPPSQVPSR